MTRFARDHRVFFVEEPRWDPDGPDRVEVREVDGGVRVVVPVLDARPAGAASRAVELQRALLDRLFRAEDIGSYVLWYYTPMALPFTHHLSPAAIVYDCMDELTGFAGAPPELGALEAELLAAADVVTTGGQSLYEARRNRHPNIHPFPSSIDVRHFAGARDLARASGGEPADQAAIGRPRIGFAGVIDERMDLDLLRGVAEARPEWQLVLLGPVAKIRPDSLPALPNVHRLGMKPYQELPSYFAGWDVGMLPFAHNQATRYISPTKTPEYLAAGLPVVSTAIRDVVRPYGQRGLVRIADDPASFVAAVEAALADDRAALASAADAFLRHNSWDDTARRMRLLFLAAVDAREDAGGELAAAGAEAP